GAARRAEDREAQPGEIERRRADALEDDGRKPRLHRLPREVVRGNFVDGEAGKRVVFAEPLDAAVVHVVVAESAEIEGGKGIAAIPRGDAGRAAEPERRMREERKAELEARVRLRVDVALGERGVEDQLPGEPV